MGGHHGTSVDPRLAVATCDPYRVPMTHERLGLERTWIGIDRLRTTAVKTEAYSSLYSQCPPLVTSHCFPVPWKMDPTYNDKHDRSCEDKQKRIMCDSLAKSATYSRHYLPLKF
jgi:hypothetical protein